MSKSNTSNRVECEEWKCSECDSMVMVDWTPFVNPINFEASPCNLCGGDIERTTVYSDGRREAYL